MKHRREDALQAALEAAARGRPVDEVVFGLPPEEAEEIRSLLAAASAARELGHAEVPPEAARRSRSRLTRRAAVAPNAIGPHARTLVPRFAAATMLALVALAIGFGGLNEAAAHALPGDVLYPVKVAAADLRLRLEFEAGQRLRLETLYAEQRLEDVRRLLALGRIVPVSFHGQVLSIGPIVWEVQGIAVRLTSHTRVVGEILPGMLVEVEGTTQADGSVLADELHLESYDTLGTLEAIDAEQLTVDGRIFLLTPRSVLEPGLVVGQRALLRVAVDDAGLRTVVSAMLFSPPTPTSAPSSTATIAPARTPTSPVIPTPAVTPSDDHSGPGGGESGEGSEGDDGSGNEDQEPEKIEFKGVVQSIGASQWVVDGRSITVDGATEIKDSPAVGDTVKVVAFLQADGTWWAEKIELDD